MEKSDVFPVEDVPVTTTWERLMADPRAVLGDVRTRAEWAFVGVPDLRSTGREPLLIEWQSFPDNRVAANFVASIEAALQRLGARKDDEVFFLCRSGGRSRMAAEAMAAAGYRRCRNVADGFEGPLDADRHRGQVAGWKAAGLAWVQG